MLKTKIETLLFISPKPMDAKSLANILNKQGEKISTEEVEKTIEELKEKYNLPESGIQIIQAGDGYQMVSNPDESELVKKFVRDDMTGELTPASLETLTVIAYRGPISKPDLEQIRGVNCSMIIRNLLIRGLIMVEEDKTKLQNYYQVTADFIKYLGLNSAEDLPDYA
ncbi:SMC-Scp complex subunit ScpB, partial [Patescibacteria group bacterium]|nr:SMC-Scp complex subunit ScpB [Patescibacteria group bacterium]